MSTYTDNEADRCEGFKKVSIEIVQGYEYTIHGYKCINKCTLEVNKFHSFYQTYWCTFSRNYQGFQTSCTPCISLGEFYTKTFYLPKLWFRILICQFRLLFSTQNSQPFQISGLNFLIFHLSPLISVNNLFEISHLSPNTQILSSIGLMSNLQIMAPTRSYSTTVNLWVLTRLV